MSDELDATDPDQSLSEEQSYTETMRGIRSYMVIYSLNIHLQQQMGSFQASMLEAFQSLREELTAKKQTEVDQTSVSATKPGTSSRTAVNLDLPPPRLRTTIQTEDIDVDYGPALPPCLGPDPRDTSDQNVSASELVVERFAENSIFKLDSAF